MRIFLDTNVFIIGAVDLGSPEARIMSWLGYRGGDQADVDVIVCKELLDQILRVGRRVGDKDFSGQMINRIWNVLSIEFVSIDEVEIQEILHQGLIPQEDIEIFLGAKNGDVDYFVSSNHKLIKAIGVQDQLFESYTADDFCKVFIDS